jgi:hypothetical protein
MSDAAFFHHASGAVRFSVSVEGQPVGASIGSNILRHVFRTAEDADPLTTYGQHIEQIHAAVRHRLGNGSLEPVLLREYDLRAPG